MRHKGSSCCVMTLFSWRRHLAMNEEKHKVIHAIMVSEGGYLKLLGQ